MTVNPFLVWLPRDWKGTDFVSKGELYPCEAGSQSSLDSSENITVYTKGWSSNIPLNVISFEISYETSDWRNLQMGLGQTPSHWLVSAEVSFGIWSTNIPISEGFRVVVMGDK